MLNNEKLKTLMEEIESQIDFSNVKVKFDEKSGEIEYINVPLKNPILDKALRKSVLAQISNIIRREEEKKKELYDLWKEKKEKIIYEEKFRSAVVEIIISQLEDKFESEDLSTSIFPTSVASSEVPNYYIRKPKERYTLETKIELFKKLSNSYCGQYGEYTYGLYIPEEAGRIRAVLRKYLPDFYNVDIHRIAGVERNVRIEPFEYLFYFLDKALQEIFFTEKTIPDWHVELFVVKKECEKKRGGEGKLFYSYYIIPNLADIFSKLYHGEDKYDYWSGKSKIKILVSSFLIEKWNIEKDLKEDYSEIVHSYINRLLYFLFYHKRLDLDSILFLEDLKIKLGDTTTIKYLDDIVSYMISDVKEIKNKAQKIKVIKYWAQRIAKELIKADEGDTKTLERFLMDLRHSNLPHEFSNAIVNNITIFKKSGIDVGEIPFALQHFRSITEFKEAKAIVIGTLYNEICRTEKAQTEETQEEGGNKT